MATEEVEEKEFIIPTRYKSKIGSYLSWPAGALELTKALSSVPQIKLLRLEFNGHPQNQRKGSNPVSFRVIEVRYAYHRTQYAPIAGWNDGSWNLAILAVPREIRSKIRDALKEHGFGLIANWLTNHAEFSGREGNLNYVGTWNSELNELSFGQRESVLPEISSNKQIDKK